MGSDHAAGQDQLTRTYLINRRAGLTRPRHNFRIAGFSGTMTVVPTRSLPHGGERRYVGQYIRYRGDQIDRQMRFRSEAETFAVKHWELK